MLLLNVSSRTCLQVFVDQGANDTPSEDFHHFPLGDVSVQALEKLFKSSLKMEAFEDSSPFVYRPETDTVEYV